MADHRIQSKWTQGLAFDNQVDGFSFRVDAGGADKGASGPSPKKLLLVSLADCSGMDVVSLLQKMRVPFTGLDIDVEADLSDEHPKVYTDIRMVYRVYGTDLKRDKVEKAIQLSQDRYCGVAAMLRANSPIHYEIRYEETVEV